jgi:hypothetical protein
MPAAPGQPYWDNVVRALAWRVRLAAWLGRVGPGCFAAATAGAVLVFAARRSDWPLAWAWGLATAAIVAACAAGIWRARREFFSLTEARVLLESHLRLDTRLTAAQLGLVAWPPRPAQLPSIVAWRVRMPLTWLGSAAALLVVASLAPVPRGSAVGVTEKPPALVQTEAMLQQLEQLKAAEPRAVEELQQRAAELARKPAEQQYQHSALEAADALRQQTAAAITGLGRGLKSAAESAAAAGRKDEKAQDRLAAALAGLKGGQLPANSSLMPGDAAGLTAEQLAGLAEQLGGLGAAALGIGGVEGEVPGIGEGLGQGEGTGFGSGGEGGGGDTGPLGLKPENSDAGAGKLAGLVPKTPKLSIGDKVGTTNEAHDVDPNQATTPMSGGAVSGTAAGGEAVWVDRLTPTERAALRKFFK